MKKIYILIAFLLYSYQNISAQELQLSASSEISIITVGPGNELFEAFGHSAIRIKDPALRLDNVYNYGMFDFNQPNFYMNFAKGRLLYKLGVYPFHYFVQNNKRDKRWMKEQVLNLTQVEKQAFFQFLQTNALPQNASYAYDPYFDNCATKLRDITYKVLGNKVEFNSEYVTQNLTLRQLMNKELPWNTWGSFGINLALGTKLDQKTSAAEYMYLPDYVYSAFNSAKKIDNNGSVPLIKKEVLILDFKEKKVKINWYNPFTIFSFLFVVSLFVTYKDFKRQKQSKWFDFLLFFVTGLMGALIVFLWFFTNHTTTPNNFNLLWTFVPNLIVSFVFLRKTYPKWVGVYVKICTLLLIVTSILWILKVQLFSFAILPILGILFFRYYFLSRLLSLKE